MLRPLALALLLLAPRLPAQAGQNGAVLLELPASARALALGNAFVAAGRDESAIFYNPAQLATLRGAAAGLSVERYLASSTLAAGAIALPIGPGTAAVGVQLLDFGSEDEVVPDPAFGGQRGMPTGGSVSAQDYAVTLGYGITVRRVRVGAAGKVIGERLAGESGNTGAVDVGAGVDVWRGLTFAGALQNLGGQITTAGSSAPLPRRVTVGAALPFATGPLRVIGTLQVSQVRKGSAEPAGGVEVAWTSGGSLTLVGRAGALTRESGSAMSPVTVGGGVRLRHVALDYAYQGFDVLGATHRLGVRWWR